MDNVSSKPQNLWRSMIMGLLMPPVLALAMVDALNEGLDPSSKQPCPTRDPRMDPTYEVLHGQDVVWQIPPNPKSVLFLAHGGELNPFRFFDPGPKCEPCSGMPEDRTITLQALQRGYAVIAVKSIGPLFVPSPERSEDLLIVTSIIKEWTLEHSLERLPLSAYGDSAGGFFVVSLSLKLPIRALILMCSEGLSHETDRVHFPPTFFAYMPIEESPPGLRFNVTTKYDVQKAMATLIDLGVPVAEKQCLPKPVSPLFFAERIRCMSDVMSASVYEAYEAEGWLDSDGYLTKDPMANVWESVLLKWNALPFCVEMGDLCLADDVHDELKMAEAVHSMTSDANEEMFDWLDLTLSLGSQSSWASH